MGSFLGGPSDCGPDVPPVPTPDLKTRAKLADAGHMDSNIVTYWMKAIASCLAEVLKIVITGLAGVFDEVLSLIVPFVTAGQGIGTGGFYDLVAAILSDLLGVEVSSDSLQQAHDKRGTIGAMQAAGGDLFNVLANEFMGKGQGAEPGAGIAGLPGTEGTPLTPQQGVDAAKAFLGFVLSFSVRQGNVAVLTDALSIHLLGQIREYGEQMAQNLGLSRLVRQALRPFVQTMISTPFQEGLNRQYRPHVMDAKQIAGAFIRGDIDRSDYADRLKGLGYKDGDIELLIADTYNRLPFADIFLLHENGIITDSDLQTRIASLGFNTSDIGLMVQARQYAAVQAADRAYAEIIAAQLVDGTISQGQYDADLATLKLPAVERDAYTRNAAARKTHHHKTLSLGFLKKVYLDAGITLDELLTHLANIGYSQDDIDIIEVEVLTEQKAAAKKAAAIAAAVAAKAAGKAAKSSTPPNNPPATPAGG